MLKYNEKQVICLTRDIQGSTIINRALNEIDTNYEKLPNYSLRKQKWIERNNTKYIPSTNHRGVYALGIAASALLITAALAGGIAYADSHTGHHIFGDHPHKFTARAQEGDDGGGGFDGGDYGSDYGSSDYGNSEDETFDGSSSYGQDSFDYDYQTSDGSTSSGLYDNSGYWGYSGDNYAGGGVFGDPMDPLNPANMYNPFSPWYTMWHSDSGASSQEMTCIPKSAVIDKGQETANTTEYSSNLSRLSAYINETKFNSTKLNSTGVEKSELVCEKQKRVPLSSAIPVASLVGAGLLYKVGKRYRRKK